MLLLERLGQNGTLARLLERRLARILVVALRLVRVGEGLAVLKLGGRVQGPVPAFLRRILYDGVEGSGSQAEVRAGLHPASRHPQRAQKTGRKTDLALVCILGVLDPFAREEDLLPPLVRRAARQARTPRTWSAPTTLAQHTRKRRRGTNSLTSEVRTECPFQRFWMTVAALSSL